MNKQVIQRFSSYSTKQYQKLSDPTFQKAVAECIVDFLAYLLIKRDIQLNHRVSRDPTRSSNQNLFFQSVTIIEMMRRFNLNHNLFENFEVPMVLLPFSSFYTKSCSDRIKRGTFYRVLGQVLKPEFREKYPAISFSFISGLLSSCHQIYLASYEIELLLQDYQYFLSNRRTYYSR